MKNWKKLIAMISAMALAGTILAGCDSDDGGSTSTTGGGGGGGAQTAADAIEDSGSAGVVAENVEDEAGVTEFHIMAFTDEVPKMVRQYKAQNPDFPYEIKETIIATTEGAYQPALDQLLMSGGADAPDMYAAESAFVLKYTQGSASQYAGTFKDFGIDVDKAITDAKIARYAYEIGMRDGAVVGLPYQATGGAFIYRRSLAKDVWGTDDPATIKGKVGPGWDKFIEAAAEVKAKGYSMLSGAGDIWQVMRDEATTPWIVNDKLVIDPARENFLDVAKTFKDNDYFNDSPAWGDPWFADMRDEGIRPVMGFFGPAWLINYVMADNAPSTSGDWAICEPPVGFSWGGTWVLGNKDSRLKKTVGDILTYITLDTSESGLMYAWANGTFDGGDGTSKDTVASEVVMNKSNGETGYLGGQNMFEIFGPAGALAKGSHMTEYDEQINSWWQGQVSQYYSGNKTREEAIESFKQEVNDHLAFGS